MSNEKKYYLKRIKNYKLIEGNEEFFPNGESKVILYLSNELEKENNSMTNNGIAKLLDNVIIEMRTGFAKIGQEIAEIKQDIVEMKQEIVEIKQDIVEIKQDIVEIKQDIVEIKTRLDEHDEIFKRNNIK